jgi:hypothetical protein
MTSLEGDSHDPFMAKLPGGGGCGRYDHARNADRSLRHVMVVRIGGFALKHDPEADRRGSATTVWLRLEPDQAMRR